MTKLIAIVHFDENGEISYEVCGEKIRMFIIDERTPHDRVYEWTLRCDQTKIDELLRDDPIGSSSDDRHEAISAVVNEVTDGTPRLTLVETQDLKPKP